MRSKNLTTQQVKNEIKKLKKWYKKEKERYWILFVYRWTNEYWEKMNAIESYLSSRKELKSLYKIKRQNLRELHAMTKWDDETKAKVFKFINNDKKLREFHLKCKETMIELKKEATK